MSDETKPADLLEPNDALTFLRFQALRARAEAAGAAAQSLALQHGEAQRAATELAAKAAALITPVREKYALTDADNIDDETFAIKRATAK